MTIYAPNITIYLLKIMNKFQFNEDNNYYVKYNL